MCEGTACVGCGSGQGLRKLTPTNFICEGCQEKFGLDAAAQFANEADWLSEALAEAADALIELSVSPNLDDQDKVWLKRASIFVDHTRNRYSDSLVLVTGA